MSNPSTLILQLASLVANGISLSQTPGAAGNLTINGSLATAGVATFDVARRVAIASNGVDTARVFTITGTDRNGNVQTDTITGVNTASVNSTLDFLTVTRIAVDAATAGAITAGTSGTGSSVWVLDNFELAGWSLVVAVSIPSGSVTYTVEHTYDDPNKVGTSLVISPQQFSLTPAGYVPPLAWPDGTLTGKTTNGETTFPNQPIMAHRLTITAGTGRAVMQSMQAGIT